MPITTNLYSADRNGRFEVISVPNIKLLESMGLRNGTQVSIQNRYRLGGPVLLRVENSYSLALGKDIAIQIGVKRVGV